MHFAKSSANVPTEIEGHARVSAPPRFNSELPQNSAVASPSAPAVSVAANPLETDAYTTTTGTNRLASITTTAGARTLGYDLRGNLASEARPGGINITAAYDGYARLTAYSRTGESSLNHLYNGLDDRVATISTLGPATDTRRYLTAPDGRSIGEYGASAADVKAEYIWMQPEAGESASMLFGGDDGAGGYLPLAVVSGSTLSYVHGNHLGVPLLYTDASGTAIAAPTGYNAPGFAGQSRTFADLYYNRYRDYDPSTGRYIQADPIGLAGGAEPYGYAGNNPLRYSDPLGLRCLNLFAEPNMQQAAAQQCAEIDPNNSDDVTHVFSHGTPNGICPANQSCMPAERFNDLYGGQWSGSKKLFVWACNVGRRPNGAAQSLANVSRMPVTGYDNVTWWNANTGMTGSAGRQPTTWEWIRDGFGLFESHDDASEYVHHTGDRDPNQPGHVKTFYPQ